MVELLLPGHEIDRGQELLPLNYKTRKQPFILLIVTYKQTYLELQAMLAKSIFNNEVQITPTLEVMFLLHTLILTFE